MYLLFILIKTSSVQCTREYVYKKWNYPKSQIFVP